MAEKIVKQSLLTTDELKTNKEKIRYLRDKDREKVRGIFHNYESRGSTIKFPIRLYPGDQIETHTLTDGQTYEIPLGVAKHLNKHCYVETHTPLPGSDIMQGSNLRHGKAMTAVTKVKRFGFQSLEFVDTDDLTMDGKPMNEVIGIKLS
jgi:hypothetical protein